MLQSAIHEHDSSDLRVNLPAAFADCPQALFAVIQEPVTLEELNMGPLKLIRAVEFHVTPVRKGCVCGRGQEQGQEDAFQHFSSPEFPPSLHKSEKVTGTTATHNTEGVQCDYLESN